MVHLAFIRRTKTVEGFTNQAVHLAVFPGDGYNAVTLLFMCSKCPMRGAAPPSIWNPNSTIIPTLYAC